jgi:hypothetical protein
VRPRNFRRYKRRFQEHKLPVHGIDESDDHKYRSNDSISKYLAPVCGYRKILAMGFAAVRPCHQIHQMHFASVSPVSLGELPSQGGVISSWHWQSLHAAALADHSAVG